MDNETRQMFELVLNKLDSMENRMGNMYNRMGNIENRMGSIEKRQDEMYILQRGMEENLKVTRAEQEKMMYILADIQGKVTKLTEEVEQHENVISQIRAIK